MIVKLSVLRKNIPFNDTDEYDKRIFFENLIDTLTEINRNLIHAIPALQGKK